MRGGLAAAALVLGLAPAAAHAEDLPPARLAVIGSVRHGTTSVANDIGFGGGVGLEAAYQPMSVGQRLGWSASWTLMWGWFGQEPAARINGSLDLVELDLALRARFAPTPSPGRCLTFGVGGMLLRSNERLPPDDKRSYIGPFAEIGYEHLAFGQLTATIHLRLGPLATGPTILTALLGIGIAM